MVEVWHSVRGAQAHWYRGTGEEREGAKTTIFRVLKDSEAPLTTAQLWSELEVCVLLAQGAQEPCCKPFLVSCG